MSKVLLHIGFPKAGSTFLGDWFHRHPDIVFKDFALAGFSDTTELMNFSAKNPDGGKKVFVLRDMRFSAPYASDHKNLDNIEDFQKRVADTLFSLFPQAKVLIVTRGYESAIRANYSQYLKQGGLLKFRKYVDKGRNSTWLPFNYSFLIGLYLGLFKKENVLVIPFELLKSDPGLFLSKIEGFLELQHFPFQPGKKNESLSPQNMSLIRNMNKMMFWGLFIFGPFQFLFFKLYLKILDKQKTKSWNNPFFSLISGFLKPADCSCLSSGIVLEKFKAHSGILNDHPDFQNFKKEYLIH